MNFGQALNALKSGSQICRSGWNGKGMWLKLIAPADYTINRSVISDIHVEQMLSWVGMKTADKCFVPWLASQTDILAEDWEVVQTG